MEIGTENVQKMDFVIRKIENTGSYQASEKLDDYTLLRLYTPVKKYFIKEHKAPVVLNIHRTRDGIACLDFIRDNRCPEDFDENRLISLYLDIVDGYVKSHEDLEEYRRNLRDTIPMLLGEKVDKKTNVVIDPYLIGVYANAFAQQLAVNS